MTDKDDLDQKYHGAWITELSHILSGTTQKEIMWNNTEEINGRAILDSSSKYIFLPENYINLILDIWKLNLTKCPMVENEKKTHKYIKCSNITNSLIRDIKSIYFIIEGYAFLLTGEELFFECTKNFIYNITKFSFL